MKTPIESAAQILAPLGATYAEGTLSLDLAPLCATLNVWLTPHGMILASAGQILDQIAPRDVDGPQLADYLVSQLQDALAGEDGLATKAETLLSIVPLRDEVGRDAMRAIMGQSLAWDYRLRQFRDNTNPSPLASLTAILNHAGIEAWVKKNDGVTLPLPSGAEARDEWQAFAIECMSLAKGEQMQAARERKRIAAIHGSDPAPNRFPISGGICDHWPQEEKDKVLAHVETAQDLLQASYDAWRYAGKRRETWLRLKAIHHLG